MDAYSKDDLVLHLKPLVCANDVDAIKAIVEQWHVRNPLYVQFIGLVARENARALSICMDKIEFTSEHYEGATHEAIRVDNLESFKCLMRLQNFTQRDLEHWLLLACKTSGVSLISTYLIEIKKVYPACLNGKIMLDALVHLDFATLEYLLHHTDFLSTPVRNSLVDEIVQNRRSRDFDVLITDPTFRDYDFGKVLVKCCAQNREDLCLSLINRRVDIHYNDNEPFITASLKENVAIFKLLVSKGVSVNCRDSQVLKDAYREKSVVIFKLLVEHGADLSCLSQSEQAEMQQMHLQRDRFAEAVRREFSNDQNNRRNPSTSASSSSSRKRNSSALDNACKMVLNRLTDDDECPVCLDKLKDINQRDIMFWNDCCHMLCRGCRSRIHVCPLCRNPGHV